MPETLSTCTLCSGAVALVPAGPDRLCCPSCGAGYPASPDSRDLDDLPSVQLVSPSPVSTQSLAPVANPPAPVPTRPAPGAPVPPDFPFSSNFLKQYSFLRLLGRGGMGAVYLMKQERLARLVAVKVLKDRSVGQTQVDRLMKEAQLLAGLNHEAIVGVYDVGLDGELAYMVVEFVDGETLTARLRRQQALNLRELLKLTRQILDGLRFAHDSGIIHRDLKPDNIFLTKEGKPKIGDFGLAKALHLPSATTIGTVMGTPAYMSPEQCRGRTASPASDLYALGVMLFFMLTDRLPFPGPKVEDFLIQHIQDLPLSCRTVRPALPAELDAILKRALEKDPERRFRSASEFSRAVHEVYRSLSAPRQTGNRRRASVKPEAGVKLAERYELVRTLGAGAMGQVWLAVDASRGGVEVALKLLPPELWRDAAAREDLVREANVSLRLAHPNIVRLNNLEPGDPPFLVMEYVAGETLADIIARRRSAGESPLSADELLPVLDQIAGGLDYAHQRNVLHRDIKPANVILEKDASGAVAAKLLDFGIAAELSSIRARQTGAAPTGTLAYMSPEQVACRTLDARSDVYAVGVTLYQCLTLTLPYSGGDLAHAIQNEPVPEPAGVSGAIARVLARAMAKRPSDRPQSARALEAEFRAALEGDDPSGPTLAPSSPGARSAADSVLDPTSTPPATAALDPGLLARIEDGRPSVRAAAASELAAVPVPEAALKLRRLTYHDPNPTVRYEARKALDAHRKALSRPAGTPPPGLDAKSFPAALAAEDPSRRMSALSWMLAARFEAGLPELAGRLEKEPDPEVRALATTVLGRLGGPAELPVLMRLQADPDPRVRSNALEVLVYLDPDQVYPVAVTALKDADHRVKSTAAALLYCAGSAGVLQVLERMITSGQPAYQDSAAHAVSVLPHGVEALALLEQAVRCGCAPAREKAVKCLAEYARTGRPWSARAQDILDRTREEAASTLSGPPPIDGARPGLPTIGDLERALCSRSPAVRRECVREILQSEARDLLGPLVEHLSRETDQSVRATIATALGRLGGLEHAPQLVGLLDDPNPRVVASAVEALGRLGDPATFRDLYRLRDHPHRRVRANVAVALGAARDYDVGPILEHLARSPGAADRRAARWAAHALGDSELKARFARFDADRGDEVTRPSAGPLVLGASAETVRVFVSSSEDLTDERELLAREVFPRLAARCAAHGLSLLPVDLRHGSRPDAIDSALPIALEELERCRPLFVGLLGERWGRPLANVSVPDSGRFDWILREEPGKHSATSLEFWHRLRGEDDAIAGAFFYFRDPAFLRDPAFERDVPVSERQRFQEPDPGSAAQLASLKARIRELSLPLLDGYPCRYARSADGGVTLTGLWAPDGCEDSSRLGYLGDRILEDLWQAIRQARSSERASAEHIDRDRQERLLTALARGQVGRTAARESLSAHARDTSTVPLVVAGNPGMGKTSLLASWCVEQRALHPDDILVAHLDPAGPSTGAWRGALRSVCHGLIHGLGLTRDVPADPERLPALFEELLAAGSGRRIVIVIDAVDRLDQDAGRGPLAWLPARFPPHARILVAAADGPAADELLRREAASVRLSPLPDEDALALAREVLAGSRKVRADQQEPGASELEVFLAKVRNKSPLYVTTLLEELRKSPGPEAIQTQLGQLPDDEESLMSGVLDTLVQEALEHPDLVRIGLPAIALSRSGLLEAELKRLPALGGGELGLAWARIQLRLRPYLLPGTDRLLLRSRAMERAVRARFLSTEAIRGQSHAQLAAALEARSSSGEDSSWRGSVHALAELVHHHRMAGSTADVARLLTDVDYISSKLEMTGPAELLQDFASSETLPGAAASPAWAVAAAVGASLSRNLAVTNDSRTRPDAALANALHVAARQNSALTDLHARFVARATRPTSVPWLRLREAAGVEAEPGFPGAADRIRALGHAPAGRKIVSGSQDGGLIVWNETGGPPQTVIRGPAVAVTALACAADGTRFAAGADDGSVRVRDAVSGAELAMAAAHRGAVTALVTNPDATFFVSGGADGGVSSWNLEARGSWLPGALRSLVGSQVLRGRPLEAGSAGAGPVRCLALAADGSRIAVARDSGEVGILSLNGQQTFARAGGSFAGVSSLAFSPVGHKLVVGLANGDVVLVEEPGSRRTVLASGGRSGVTCLASSADGRELLAGHETGDLRLWSVASASQVAMASLSTPLLSCRFTLRPGFLWAAGVGDRERRPASFVLELIRPG